MEWNDNIRYFLWYHLFGLFWSLNFVLALCEFVIACAVTIWYFAKDGDATLPVTRGLYRAFIHHIGSIAFGSLLLAIIWMV